MKKLVNERGWTAHSNQVKVMLGLTAKAKLPVAGMPAREVQGIQVYVNPIKPGRKIHRVMAICPDCGTHLSAGRLHQHVCKK